MRTQFSKGATTVDQIGRRISVRLKERVEKELNKMIDQKYNLSIKMFSLTIN